MYAFVTRPADHRHIQSRRYLDADAFSAKGNDVSGKSTCIGFNGHAAWRTPQKGYFAPACLVPENKKTLASDLAHPTVTVKRPAICLVLKPLDQAARPRCTRLFCGHLGR